MKEILDDLREIVGGNVSLSPTERCCYASDASMVEGLPDYVVRPKSTQEVSRLLRYCNNRHIFVTPRGAAQVSPEVLLRFMAASFWIFPA